VEIVEFVFFTWHFDSPRSSVPPLVFGTVIACCCRGLSMAMSRQDAVICLNSTTVVYWHSELADITP
jgi:hypothetical protein